MAYSAFKINGSLSLVEEALASIVGNKIDESFRAREYNAARDKAALSTQAYNHYIQVTMDINSKVNFTKANNSGTGSNDDAWGLDTFKVGHDGSAKVGAYDSVEMKLPTNTVNNIKAGSVAVNDIDGTTALTPFAVKLQMVLSDTGALTATASVDTATLDSSNVADDALKYQFVQFEEKGFSTPSQATLDANNAQPDKLKATINDQDIATAYSQELDDLEAAYTMSSVIASWELDVDAISSGVESSLALHARENGKGDKNVFDQNDCLVLASPAEYELSVLDATGASVELIAKSDVYGVIKQN